MSFASDTGYVPVTFDSMMEYIRIGLNAQFNTGYTVDTFIGSNHYKYFYVLVQRALENENKAAEIFAKLQLYISTTNERIQRPSVSLPGIIDSFTAKGYTVAVRPSDLTEAGHIEITVDVDDTAPDYASKKTEIALLISQFVVAGIITDGTEVTTLGLSNGQFFDFKFRLPYRSPTLLRLTVEKSLNHITTIPSDEDIRLQLFENIKARYRLGWNFEPQRYFTQVDAPWAGDILLEWSIDDGATWSSEVKVNPSDYLHTFSVADIEVEIE